MVTLPGETSKKTRNISDAREIIGKAASDWATLEFLMNNLIWTLADVPPAYGACLTAQIYSIDGRIKALLSLLELRKADKTSMGRVKKFADAVRGPAEKRNRLVHDPWGFGINTGEPSKIEVTANRRLVFKMRRMAIADMAKDGIAVAEAVGTFLLIRDHILSVLPSWPEISPSELHPLREGPRLRE